MNLEAISLSQENTPPPAWELNEKQKPKDAANVDNCAQALEFFNRNPQWVVSNTEIGRRYAVLIAQTDFSGTKWSVSIPKIKESLMEIFPDLFPSTIVIIGKVTRKILNERLAEISPKFQVMIDSEFVEGERKQIRLQLPDGIDRKTIRIFADYLAGEKEIVIDGKNVFLLLLLASEHRLRKLEKACSDYLSSRVGDNLGAIVNFASRYDLGKITDYLKRRCFEVATEKRCFELAINSSNSLVQTILETEDLHPQAKFILETAIANAQFAKNNANYAVKYDSQTLILGGYSFMKIDATVLGIIAAIQTFSLPISRLEIGIIGIDNENLEKLCNLVPNPEEITLKNAKVAELPKRWLESLKYVRMENCWAVKRVVLPNAKNVDFRKCNVLESVEAPNAEEVFFANCTGLVNSKVFEKTRSARYKKCKALEQVEAMNAVNIRFESCPSLKKIDAPGTKKFNFSKCPSLQEIKVAGGCYFEPSLPPDCQITCVGEGGPQIHQTNDPCTIL